MTKPNYDATSKFIEAGGWTLIPLHHHATTKTLKSKSGKSKVVNVGKAPVHKDWTNREYNPQVVLDDVTRKAANVGLRLRKTQLGIDVDPRNFPEGETLDTPGNPLDRLQEDWGFDYRDHPHVVTGSGGLHIFFSKPEDIAVVNGLEKYPGIEFKSDGRQLVAAGSIHPETQKPYRLVEPDPIDGLGSLGALAPCPPGLLDAIRRPNAKATRAERVRQATDGAREDTRVTLGAGQIAEVLPLVNIPGGEGLYEDWLAFCQAAHFASDGCPDVLTELEVWCDEDANLAARWEGFGSYTGAPVTFGTLRHIALKYCQPEDQGTIEAWATNVRGASDFTAVAEEAEFFEQLEGERKAKQDADGNDPLPNNDPMTIAQGFARSQPAMLRNSGMWLKYEHEKGAYEILDDEAIEAEMWKYVRGRAYADGDKVKHLKSGTALVGNVKGALKSQSQGPRKLPAWNYTGAKPLPDPGDLLPVRNGLLHLRTGKLLPPTAMFVNLNVSAVDFDPEAECPLWHETLRQWFTPENGENAGRFDQEAVDCLQEFMGLCLTPDVSHQKFLYLLGGSRSGKSTILRVLNLLLGEGYTAAEEDQIVGDHGLQNMTDASAIVFADFRNTRKDKMAKLVSILLKVVGGDMVTINPKFGKPFNWNMTAKVWIASNVLPHFVDHAGAMNNRMVLVKMPNTYLGREDPQLYAKLATEASGILNWALAGLMRLRNGKSLASPKSSRWHIEGMRRRNSPAECFFEERLRMAPGEFLTKSQVAEGLEDWLDEHDMVGAIGSDQFFRFLFSQYGEAGVKSVRKRLAKGQDQTYCVQGLTWRKEPSG